VAPVVGAIVAAAVHSGLVLITREGRRADTVAATPAE